MKNAKKKPKQRMTFALPRIFHIILDYLKEIKIIKDKASYINENLRKWISQERESWKILCSITEKYKFNKKKSSTTSFNFREEQLQKIDALNQIFKTYASRSEFCKLAFRDFFKSFTIYGKKIMKKILINTKKIEQSKEKNNQNNEIKRKLINKTISIPSIYHFCIKELKKREIIKNENKFFRYVIDLYIKKEELLVNFLKFMAELSKDKRYEGDLRVMCSYIWSEHIKNMEILMNGKKQIFHSDGIFFRAFLRDLFISIAEDNKEKFYNEIEKKVLLHNKDEKKIKILMNKGDKKYYKEVIIIGEA